MKIHVFAGEYMLLYCPSSRLNTSLEHIMSSEHSMTFASRTSICVSFTSFFLLLCSFPSFHTPLPFFVNNKNNILMTFNKIPRTVSCTGQVHHPLFPRHKRKTKLLNATTWKDIFVKTRICAFWVFSPQTLDGIFMGTANL